MNHATKHKAVKDDFGLYEAIMDHGYANSEGMRARMDLAGILHQNFQLKEFCLTHTRLWDDGTVQRRMREKINARPTPVFSAVKFLELPFESKYWQNASPDFCAYEVFDEVMAEMTEGEKSELRTRIKGAVK